MKKVLSFLTALLIFGIWNSSFAQIKMSGDLQVRPRYDMKDNGSYGGKTNDMYYMMRARMNFKANLGDGWFGHIRLSHYNYAGYFYSSGLDVNSPSILGNELIARPSVNFNLAYFGYHGKSWGVEGGIIPMNALKDPILDAHYYANKMIDIPFTIYGLNSKVGFQGYFTAGKSGKINWFATKDFNEKYSEDINGNVLGDNHDIYTFGLNYALKAGGFFFQPEVMFTWASDSMMAPVTFGANFATPKFGGYTLSLNGAYTSQKTDGTAQYDGYLFRIKLQGKVGTGTAQIWYDIAKRTDNGFNGVGPDVDHNYGYLWAAYKIPVMKSAHGAVTIIPRVRYITETVDNAKDYSRAKIECLFVASFK